MSEDWYLVDSERSVGPFSLEELAKRIRKDASWTTALVWKADFSDWKKAGDVSELKLRLAAPPPVPSSLGTDEPPSWKVRWWWYVVALLFFGSIGSRDGRKAMAWASSERSRLRKLRRRPPNGEAGTKEPEFGIAWTEKISSRKPRSIIILSASVLYGLYLGFEKPSVISGLAGGAIGGVMFVGLAEVIAWLLRIFRETLPRTAFYAGTTLFWLGILVAVWCAGLSIYLVYVQAPVKLVGMFAGFAVLYGLLGWGIRHALVR